MAVALVAELNKPEGIDTNFVLWKQFARFVHPVKNTELLTALIWVRPLEMTVNEVQPIFPH
jgi:hypothetical protein